jgi:hypothetical protein
MFGVGDLNCGVEDSTVGIGTSDLLQEAKTKATMPTRKTAVIVLVFIFGLASGLPTLSQDVVEHRG